jgi:hypothetical protein
VAGVTGVDAPDDVGGSDDAPDPHVAAGLAASPDAASVDSVSSPAA